jgi:hypothetical protein
MFFSKSAGSASTARNALNVAKDISRNLPVQRSRTSREDSQLRRDLTAEMMQDREKASYGRDEFVGKLIGQG